MGSKEKICENEELDNYYAESTVFVAVCKQIKESESLVSWVVNKFAGRKRICILHVHQPAQLVKKFFDGKFPTSKFKQRAINAFHESDKQKLYKLISQYVSFVSQMGVKRADRMWIEMENVEEGIVKMIAQHGIKRLVMGAAADKHYTKEMAELKSQKAQFVCEQAPVSCHIWFVCKGNLIHTREGVPNNYDEDISQGTDLLMAHRANRVKHRSRSLGGPVAKFPPEPLSVNMITEEANHRTVEAPAEYGFLINSDVSTEELETESLESESLTEGESECSNDHRGDALLLDSNVVAEGSNRARLDHLANIHGSPPRLTFRERSSILRTCSFDLSSNMEKSLVSSSSLNGRTTIEDHGIEGNLQMFKFRSSFNSVMSEDIMAGKAKLQAPREIHDKLEQVTSDAECLKHLAFKESINRWKSEEDAMDAKRKADAAESKYFEELAQRQAMEEALAEQKLEYGRMNEEHEKNLKALPMVQDHCIDLVSQIKESEIAAKELEQKILSAVELLVSFRAQRDKLQQERDNAVLELNNLKKLRQRSISALSGLQFSTFSLFEIGQTTCGFDPSRKIGDGKYGSIYRGNLRHMDVAIRMLPNDGFLSQQMFEHGVEILSRLRHPNIVTLIGICPEARSVIYEYLERGSLEDLLECRGKSTPLQWQTRVRIAIELCSALIFLHSNNPPIFHGNLKPTKILLDANFISKLGDLGIFFLSPQNRLPNNSQHCTSVYIDPELIKTGVPTREADVYSFGMILLRLLTGRPAIGIVKDVKCALQGDIFESVLDFSAGDWPIRQARTLARMALRCCDRNLSKRPNLASDIWSVLEPFSKLCDAQASSYFQKKENSRPPSHFLCPIYQEVMKDPCTAADGYTYEGDAIRGWLDSGHTTSPMTNLKLSTCDLIPNHTLQYAIQEWLQRS